MQKCIIKHSTEKIRSFLKQSEQENILQSLDCFQCLKVRCVHSVLGELLWRTVACGTLEKPLASLELKGPHSIAEPSSKERQIWNACLICELTSTLIFTLLFVILTVCVYVGMCTWVQVSMEDRGIEPWSWSSRPLWAPWSGCWELNFNPPEEQQCP